MRGDVTKLPKWARQEIERLERDLANANAKLSAGPEDSDTFADAYSRQAQRPLGKGTVVEFRFGEHWGQKFRARLEDGRLKVSGGNSIAVHPRASNVVEIAVVA